MHEKLDQFRPTLETAIAVRRQLANAGIDPAFVPEDWLISIVAATRKWIATTQPGAQDAVDLLGFEWSRGDPAYSYEVLSLVGGPDRQVESEDVMLIRGAVVGGEAIMPVRLRISKRESKHCDGCGIISHCIQEIRKPRTDALYSFCNRCLKHHDDPVFRDHSGSDTCAVCTKTSCSHHPSREEWPNRKVAY